LTGLNGIRAMNARNPADVAVTLAPPDALDFATAARGSAALRADRVAKLSFNQPGKRLSSGQPDAVAKPGATKQYL